MEKSQQHYQKKIDSKPAYNEKYIKTKRKPCNGKVDTNFHNNKIPKEAPQCICLSVIVIESVYRKGKDYFPEVFLEECKYFVKEKKTSTFITDDIEMFPRLHILRNRTSNETLLEGAEIKCDIFRR